MGVDEHGNYIDLDEYRAPGAKTIRLVYCRFNFRWNPEDLYGIPMVPIGSISSSSLMDSSYPPSYTCHGCGGSALRGPLIECDFCPFSWHLDCLNPPMTMTPPTSKKWLCPLHAKHIRLRRRERRRLLDGFFSTVYANSTFLQEIEDMDEVIISPAHTKSTSFMNASSYSGYLDSNGTSLPSTLSMKCNELNYSSDMSNSNSGILNNNIKLKEKESHSGRLLLSKSTGIKKRKQHSLPIASNSRIIKISLIVPELSVSQAFINCVEEEQREQEFLTGTFMNGLELLIDAIDKANNGY